MKTLWRIAYYLFVFSVTLGLVLYSAFGVWFEIDGWAPFITTCLAICLVVQGIHDIKSDPLEYALLTWLGMRTPIGFREGIKFIPLFLGFGFERIPIKNKNIIVTVQVYTKEELLIPVKIGIDVRPDINHLQEFKDYGGEEGLEGLLSDPIVTAVTTACNGKSMFSLNKDGPLHAREIRAILNGKKGDPDSNDDFIGSGVIIPESGKLSFEAKLPEAVSESQDRAVAMEKDIKGYDKFNELVEELTDKKIARGDTRDRDVIQKDIMVGLAVQQGKTRQISISDTDNNGKKSKGGRKNFFFDPDNKPS